MTGMLKVKFPNVAKGWAWLCPSDFYKPKPDGTAWELWEDNGGTAQASTEQEETLNTAARGEERSAPAPDGEASYSDGASRKTRRKF